MSETETEEYSMSPLAHVMTAEQFKNFKEEIKSKNSRSEILEGQIITLNTKDQDGCRAAQINMNLNEDVCKYNSEKPLVSIVMLKEVKDREYFEKKMKKLH